MRDELASLAANGVTEQEFELALGSLTGGLALRYESSMARMNRLLSAEIGSGEYLSTEEILDRFKQVTMPEVQAVATRIIQGGSSLVAVGPDLSKLEQLA